MNEGEFTREEEPGGVGGGAAGSDDAGEEGGEMRAWRPTGYVFDPQTGKQVAKKDKGRPDWPALAGAQEQGCLEALGVSLRYDGVRIGERNPGWGKNPEWNGLNTRGMVDSGVLYSCLEPLLTPQQRDSCNGKVEYLALWGGEGAVASLARGCRQEGGLVRAGQCLEQATKHRESDALVYLDKKPHGHAFTQFCRCVGECRICSCVLACNLAS
jgi:hypothetical protein